YWLIALAEVATIAAQHRPTCIYSRKILDVLSFDIDLNSAAATYSLVAGSLLVVIGGVLRLQCYNALGRHFTFEAVIKRDHQLVTGGPYNYMRHPSYTGAVLAYIGLMIYYGSKGTGKILAASAAVGMSLVIIGLLCRIPNEDRALKEKFGREWDIWATEVPYVLIPKVY
ncbi:phospholipid methyltransferase-domain-containing protein, partial [Mycena olivaceomarginata]